jgi:hypothetical protein
MPIRSDSSRLCNGCAGWSPAGIGAQEARSRRRPDRDRPPLSAGPFLAPSLLCVSAEMLRLHRRLLSGALVLIAALVAGRAQAEPSADEKALATQLFQEGRALMSAGSISEACQKLQESQRLDPGGGTLLNLALCHEKEGRLARSWSEFQEAALVAHRDGRADRETEATSHVGALEPRLSRLTIVVPAGAQIVGLLVERDGRELGRGAWSTAIPIDGGPHVVRATAQGRAPFVATVVIGNEADARTVEIPVLATPVVVVAASPAVPSPAAAAAATARLRWVGVGTAGAGVILLGGAGYALARAISAREASKSDCWSDGCGSVGLQRRSDAVSRGNLATWLGVGGVVLVAAGATLLYLGRRPSAPRGDARIHPRFVLGAAPGVVVTGLQGAF